ncbi:MAG: 3-oxocholest-4-en-26-oate---CoA ligase [Actinomycetota bacterium]|nr:3-oxocholest-4-en-26-oate---CoA ligase [Actinomycetota bacterium]
MNWNFATVWESVGDALPDRLAIVQGDTRRTWREFDDRSARIANGLRAAGLGPGSKVASYLYNGNEYLEGLFASFKLRAVPVNVNYRYLEDELVYLLDNSDAEALLFHGSLGDRVAKVRDRAPKVKLWVQVDDGSPHQEFAVAYEDFVARNEPMERIERSGDDYYFLYTGGTTGMPKGVMWRNEDLYGVLGETAYPLVGATTPDRAEDAGAIAKATVESSGPRVHLPASPLMHGTGAMSSFQALFLGGTITTLEGRHFDAHEMWRTVAREHVTQMAIVGDAFAKPMVRALEEAERADKPYDVSSLQLIISSGVIWSAEVKQQLMERVRCFCLDSLGSSEGVGFANSMSTPGAEQATAKFTIGTHTKVLKDDGTEIEPGSDDIGLLSLGGFLPTGYYKDESKSAETFRVLNGRRWSVPGDFARVEADGTIVLLGRGSVCINSGGEKVFPEEVEEAVKLHPSVADCLVVGVPDERFGEAVTAVVALHPGDNATGEDIVGALDALAHYKRPRNFVFVPEVLRGPNGKADYRWARETAESQAQTAGT